MILHFITDEKFSNYAIRHFAGNAMHSELVLVSDTEELRYVNEVVGASVIKPYSDDFIFLLSRLGSYNAVVLHGMFWPWEEDVVKALPEHVKLAWVFWGGDIYGRSDLQTKFLAPRTKMLFLMKRFKRFLKSPFKREKKYEVPVECFRRIDYCLSDVHEDFEFACRYIGKPMKELWYNYYSIEDTIGPLAEDRCQGSNLLVGNSCTIECNHIDAFRKLKDIDTNVIVPLSYGESWLRSVIVRDGHKNLRHFSPLAEFMPLGAYNNILKSCSFVMMNHYRQQAFGNILTALWLGARVYLSKNNLLYDFFSRIGCILYSVEDDFSPAVCALPPLTDEEVLHNRSVLKSIYSREAINSRLKGIVKELDS